MSAIEYRSDYRPKAAEVIELYRSAGLIRPIDDAARMQRIYDGSPLVLTAWDGKELVGVMRGWTDGAYDGYVCDLAVAKSHQKVGIGKALLEMAERMYGPEVQWVLRASPVAKEYYKHIGWEYIENGWCKPRAKWQKD